MINIILVKLKIYIPSGIIKANEREPTNASPCNIRNIHKIIN